MINPVNYFWLIYDKPIIILLENIRIIAIAKAKLKNGSQNLHQWLQCH